MELFANSARRLLLLNDSGHDDATQVLKATVLCVRVAAVDYYKFLYQYGAIIYSSNKIKQRAPYRPVAVAITLFKDEK